MQLAVVIAQRIEEDTQHALHHVNHARHIALGVGEAHAGDGRGLPAKIVGLCGIDRIALGSLVHSRANGSSSPRNSAAQVRLKSVWKSAVKRAGDGSMAAIACPIIVEGALRSRQRIAHVEIETYSDHRAAMSMVLADCIAINNPGCVAKTYPFFQARP